jgi:glycine oxidase
MAVDCLVIGGGVIGLTTAWRLAQRGHSVRLVDQGHPGREASWAGAGILPPGSPGPVAEPLTALAARASQVWPKLSAELHESTGVDNEFHRCGGIELAPGSPAEFASEYHHWEAAGARVEWLDSRQVRDLEPKFSGAEAAFHLPDLCQVRNPRHLQALIRACELVGVEVTALCPVRHWRIQDGHITAAVTDHGEIAADRFVITAGAWSDQLLRSAGQACEVVPVRGQIALLSPSPVRIAHVFERGKRYLVPRRDGRILIGSTEELTGFEKGNTQTAIDDLRKFAAQICPALSDVPLETCWSGLRPQAARGRPYIGAVPGFQNLLVATGHFRAGLHLSPVTAEIICRLVNGETGPDLQAFAM